MRAGYTAPCDVAATLSSAGMLLESNLRGSAFRLDVQLLREIPHELTTQPCEPLDRTRGGAPHHPSEGAVVSAADEQSAKFLEPPGAERVPMESGHADSEPHGELPALRRTTFTPVGNVSGRIGLLDR